MFDRVCSEAWRTALDETKVKCGVKSDGEVVERLNRGDGCIHGYFRYYIVSHLIKCMSSKMTGLKGIYLFGSTMSEQSTVTSDINIIVHLTTISPEDKKTMEEINKALTDLYCKALDLDTKDCFSLLDCHFMDDPMVAAREGVASLIDTHHNPAVRVWPEG